MANALNRRPLALACLVLALPVASQVVKQERRNFAHLCQLRAALDPFLLQGDQELRREVARIFGKAKRGEALAAEAAALALVRGVKVDPQFRFRHDLQLYAMPEVVDPGSYGAVALTVYQALRMDPPDGPRFEVELRDSGGAMVAFGAVAEERSGVDDLIGYNTVLEIPVATLPVGKALHAGLRVMIGEQGPRDHDPRPGASFMVLPGFKERADRLFERHAKLPADIDPVVRAVASAAVAEVDRVYRGEPAFGAPFTTGDLERAESWVAAVHDGRLPAEFIERDRFVPYGFPCSLPVPLALRLRLPRQSEGTGPPPLVLIVPGAPAIDAHGTQASSPASVPPEELARRMEALGGSDLQNVALAILESPGRVPGLGSLLAPLCTHLSKSFGLGEWYWVGEREGAGLLSLQLPGRPPELRGAVFVLGGALPPQAVEELKEFPLLALAMDGHTSQENLRRLSLAAERFESPHIRLETRDDLPWPAALILSMERIHRFIEAVRPR